jgi:hypothetical protein
MNRSDYNSGKFKKPDYIHFPVAFKNMTSPTACGMRFGHGFAVTERHDVVTCPDCLSSDFYRWFMGDDSVKVERNDVF